MSRWPTPERTTKGWASAVKQCTLMKEWETMVRNNIIKYDSKSCGVSESTSMHKHSKATSDAFHHSPSCISYVRIWHKPGVPHLNGLASQQVRGLHLSPSSSTGAPGVPYSHPACFSVCLRLLCLIHTLLVPLYVCDCCALFTPYLFLCVPTIAGNWTQVFMCSRWLTLWSVWWILTIDSENNSYKDSLEFCRGKTVGNEKEGTEFSCLFSCLRYRDTMQLQLLESQWKNMNNHHFQDSRRKRRWKRKHYETTEIRKGRKGNIINRKTQKKMTELN